MFYAHLITTSHRKTPGRLRGYVWQVIHSTRWGEVIAKGKYLVSALVKERKKTGS